MKYGIYYAYWEHEWGVDYEKYIRKVASLGFDCLEVSCANIFRLTDDDIARLNDASQETGIFLTGGYGPTPEEDLASANEAVVKNGFAFWKKVFPVLEKLGITTVGGALYGSWPVDYTKPFDKKGDIDRAVKNLRILADMASDHGITTCGMEILNRHESYMLNTCQEGVDFVKAVDKPNIKVQLDTYHMLLEENSFAEAIRTAGDHLGHLHVGENNRRVPGQGRMVDWQEIGQALREIHYTGCVVMEPFVMPGGQVGHDIRVWRDLIPDTSESKLDSDAAESVAFLRGIFESEM